MTAWETPLHESCVDVQSDLSEYLDQTLSEGRYQQVQHHFEACPSCLEIYIQLRMMRTEISQLNTTTQVPVDNSALWDRIRLQLETDLSQPKTSPSLENCSYDDVAIGEYADGLFAKEHPGDLMFEAHLNQCSKCSERLGKMIELSKCLHDFSYRLEKNIETLDFSHHLTRTVMNQLKIDFLLPIPDQNLTCHQYNPEIWSSFLDKEVSDDEFTVLQNHLEQCPSCQNLVLNFTRLSQAIQGLKKTLESQAPDCWPSIANQITTFPEKSDNVIPFPPNKNEIKKFPVPKIPVAIASAFLLIGGTFWMTQQISTNQSPLLASKSKESVQVASALPTENAPASESTTIEGLVQPKQEHLGSPLAKTTPTEPSTESTGHIPSKSQTESPQPPAGLLGTSNRKDVEKNIPQESDQNNLDAEPLKSQKKDKIGTQTTRVKTDADEEGQLLGYKHRTTPEEIIAFSPTAASTPFPASPKPAPGRGSAMADDSANLYSPEKPLDVKSADSKLAKIPEAKGKKPNLPKRARRQKIPTAEEYLFNLNTREIPKNELPVILGEPLP